MTAPIRLRPAPSHEPPYVDEPEDTRRPAPAVVEEAAPEPLLLALADASPECHQAARRFVMLCIEICHGFRPPAQVSKISRPREAQDIVDEIARMAREVTRRKPSGMTRLDAIKPRRIRVCEPRPGVSEAAVVLAVHGSILALAFRLERQGATGPWLCTAAVML
ncbi:hypothetical protein F4553_003607 [Allocatelliglobosispora scoriae]|uniref:Uncharacterized protein n=1 Tax=Allocatelliglobosispora scoriae TaxID=643052 RepID=A0A841BS52_9ACTN|nr:Rv3235 family protein [Allocatelliglobosispora scoriae]MBB5870228.1 hypothetical protein [Allocatelliglobosispora scoriae]